MDQFCYLCFVSVMLACNSLQPCDHLLALLYVMFLSHSHVVSWVDDPELCLLSYFNQKAYKGQLIFIATLCT